MNANSIKFTSAAAFAALCITASTNAARFAHATLALPVSDLRAVAAEYTRIANSGKDGYAKVRRTLAHLSNALRDGASKNADLDKSAQGMAYTHTIRSNREGLKPGQFLFQCVEYVRNSAKSAAASAKASKSGAPSASATTRKATNAALDHANAIIRDLRAQVEALTATLATRTAERDGAVDMLAKLASKPAKPAKPEKALKVA